MCHTASHRQLQQHQDPDKRPTLVSEVRHDATAYRMNLACRLLPVMHSMAQTRQLCDDQRAVSPIGFALLGWVQEPQKRVRGFSSHTRRAKEYCGWASKGSNVWFRQDFGTLACFWTSCWRSFRISCKNTSVCKPRFPRFLSVLDQFQPFSIDFFFSGGQAHEMTCTCLKMWVGMH